MYGHMAVSRARPRVCARRGRKRSVGTTPFPSCHPRHKAFHSGEGESRHVSVWGEPWICSLSKKLTEPKHLVESRENGCEGCSKDGRIGAPHFHRLLQPQDEGIRDIGDGFRGRLIRDDSAVVVIKLRMVHQAHMLGLRGHPGSWPMRCAHMAGWLAG